MSGSVHRVDLEYDGSRRTGKHALESRNDAQGRAPLEEIRPHVKVIDVPAGAVQNRQPAHPLKVSQQVRALLVREVTEPAELEPPVPRDRASPRSAQRPDLIVESPVHRDDALRWMVIQKVD